MHESHVTVTALSFLISLVLYTWPRKCADRFRKMLERRGENPDRPLKFSEMKALDPKLYKQLVIGLIICIPFTILFIVFALLTVLH